MEKLTKYLLFIKDHHIEEVAQDNLRNARAMNLPLMKLVEGMPEEMLIKQTQKSIRDFADQMADGTYLEKSSEALKKWENDELPELKNHSIEAEDLVLIYPLQRKMFYNFLPRYTSDTQLALDILQELDELQTASQINALKVLMKKQRRTEEQIQLQSYLLDNATDTILTTDLARRITYSNKACERVFGFTKEELIGKLSSEAFKVDAVFEKFRKDTTITLEEEGNAGAELVYLDKKGNPIPVLTSASEMTDKNGERVGYFAVFKDIRQLKQAEDELKQLNHELEEGVSQLNSVNKELEAFTYSVSHDLRAPLRAVNGYATMLDEDYGNKMDEEGKRLLEVIRYNAEKMGKLIDDLLAFSKLGRKEIDKTEEDMNVLMDGVLIEMGKSIVHNAKMKIGKLHKVKVDYGLMHQALLNLVSNAVKYSSKEKAAVVEVSSEKSGNEVIIKIKDNGVGFDMLYADKLFGVFQRLHREDEFEGTGVGLAIVQRIIAKHQGRVWAEAKVDKGASFYIALPA